VNARKELLSEAAEGGRVSIPSVSEAAFKAIFLQPGFFWVLFF